MPACHAGDRRFESGRVRHHRHLPTPRPPARTGRSSASGRMPAMPRLPTTRLPLLVVVGLLAFSVAVPMAGSELGFGGGLAPATSPSAPTGSLAGGPSQTPATAAPTAVATPAPTATPVPTTSTVQAAIVPVTQFRATATATGRKEVADVLAGTSKR